MANLTPLMEQYHRIKNQHQDAVLLFRMGDFYEMFYDDAKTANKVLGITLTSRAHGKSADVPLAGFPYHALDGYLAKLLKCGHRVAICEQVEDPKLAKKIVKRKVIEKISPGTILSESILNQKSNNYIVSIFKNNMSLGFAAIDYSTGEFFTGEGEFDDVKNYIEILTPSEIVVPFESEADIRDVFSNSLKTVFSTLDGFNFVYDYSYQILLQHFKVPTMKGFDLEECELSVCASGALLNYIKKNQQSEVTHINKVRRVHFAEHMILDRAARRNLELLESNDPFYPDRSLFSFLDDTLTPMGGRKLKRWILHPLKNLDKIRKRLDGVEALYKLQFLLNDSLLHISDINQ